MDRRIRVITHKLYANFGIPLGQPPAAPTIDQDHDDVTPPDPTSR